MTEPAPAPAGRRGSGLHVLSAVVAAGVLLLDQLTKSWALEALDDRNIHLFWTLQLNLTFNSGMAFGQAEGWGPVIGVVALVVIIALLLSMRRSGSRLSAVAIGMVIGGALGNLADRAFRGGEGFLQGSVVDFIDFQWWPVFNVADIGVVVGGLLLVFDSFRHRDEPADSGDPAAA